MWKMQSSGIIYLLQIFLFLVTSFNSLRPQGEVSEGIGARLKSNIYMWIFYVFFPGVRERLQEQCVRETCEASLLLSLHPRSSLTLVLQVLHDDGSVSFRKKNNNSLICCAGN